jgi:hypothetical protein
MLAAHEPAEFIVAEGAARILDALVINDLDESLVGMPDFFLGGELGLEGLGALRPFVDRPESRHELFAGLAAAHRGRHTN